MVEASCHCGAIRIEVARAPDTVTDCNCSICRRYGTLWAYYSPKDVRIVPEGATATYAWGRKSLAFHRCALCGCVTHWAALDTDLQSHGAWTNDRMGINARLLAPDVLAAAAIHKFDGAAK